MVLNFICRFRLLISHLQSLQQILKIIIIITSKQPLNSKNNVSHWMLNRIQNNIIQRNLNQNLNPQIIYIIIYFLYEIVLLDYCFIKLLMEFNSQTYTLCDHGHEAYKLCTDNDCQNSSPFCKNQDCNSYKQHKNCFTKANVSDLVQALARKGNSATEFFDPIIDFYKEIIKSITRDMQQYQKQKSLSGSGFRLIGDQQKLFKLLKQGPSKDIIPSLVIKVAKILKKEPTMVTNNIKQSLQGHIINWRKSINEILLEIKGKWDQKQDKKITHHIQKDFKFKTLCDKVKILDNGKRIKNMEYKTGDFFKIYPFLSIHNQPNKIQIRIIKMKNFIQFGICLGKQKIAYLHNGFQFNKCFNEQNSIKTSMTFVEGDVVVLQADLMSCKLSLFNKTKNSDNRVIFDFIKRVGLELNFVVTLGDINDEVEIL